MTEAEDSAKTANSTAEELVRFTLLLTFQSNWTSMWLIFWF